MDIHLSAMTGQLTPMHCQVPGLVVEGWSLGLRCTDLDDSMPAGCSTVTDIAAAATDIRSQPLVATACRYKQRAWYRYNGIHYTSVHATQDRARGQQLTGWFCRPLWLQKQPWVP